MMKKGFTLMEMLAVLLAIAIIASFAVPAYRAVRYEIYYQRAKSAALKMGEAIRSYYQDSQGYLVSGSFTGITDAEGEDQTVEAIVSNTSVSCDNPAATGIPLSDTSETVFSDVAQLFKCGYLNAKDFVGLPYRFTACNPVSTTSDTDCAPSNSKKGLVQVSGLETAGKKFYKPDGSTVEPAFSVKRDLTIKEHEKLE